MGSKSLKSGNPAPRSGDYKVVGPRGGVKRTGVTMDKGEKMPPTPGKKQHYEK